MKTLSEVLRHADPVQSETRRPEARAVTRSVVLSGPQPHFFETRVMSRRRSLAVAAVMAAAFIATGVFAWQHVSIDAVAAMQFEARIEGTSAVILDTHDILTAEAASRYDTGPGGATKSSYAVALTFTQEGAEKMRRATEAHIGDRLELVIDGRVVIAPTIRDVVSSSAMLTGDYTRAEAQRIAEGLLKGKLESVPDR
jgi:preprotein translocase subunit SecD